MQRQPRVHDSKLPGELKCPILHPPAPLPCRTATRPRHVRAPLRAPRSLARLASRPAATSSRTALAGRQTVPPEIARDCPRLHKCRERAGEAAGDRQAAGRRQAGSREAAGSPSFPRRQASASRTRASCTRREAASASRARARPLPPGPCLSPLPPPLAGVPSLVRGVRGRQVRRRQRDAVRHLVGGETQPRDAAERRSRETQPRDGAEGSRRGDARERFAPPRRARGGP